MFNDGVKVVARILESEAVNKTGENISSCVIDKLSPLIERVEQIMESITTSTEDVRKAADRLYRTGEDTRDEILKSVESLNTLADRSDPNPLQPQPSNQPLSYAAAASRQLPLSHPSTLARSRVRECQVLIDKNPNSEAYQLADLNERELVAKANEAMELMCKESPDEGEGAKAIGAKKLRNGGIVFELSSKEASQWVRQEKD
jgi:hypothetical protein